MLSQLIQDFNKISDKRGFIITSIQQTQKRNRHTNANVIPTILLQHVPTCWVSDPYINRMLQWQSILYEAMNSFLSETYFVSAPTRNVGCFASPLHREKNRVGSRSPMIKNGAVHICLMSGPITLAPLPLVPSVVDRRCDRAHICYQGLYEMSGLYVQNKVK